MATLYIDKTNGNFLKVVLDKNDILKVVGEKNINTYTSTAWEGRYDKGIWRENGFLIVAEDN